MPGSVEICGLSGFPRPGSQRQVCIELAHLRRSACQELADWLTALLDLPAPSASWTVQVRLAARGGLAYRRSPSTPAAVLLPLCMSVLSMHMLMASCGRAAMTAHRSPQTYKAGACFAMIPYPGPCALFAPCWGGLCALSLCCLCDLSLGLCDLSAFVLSGRPWCYISRCAACKSWKEGQVEGGW
jgi:hypothetical protein